MHALDVSVSRLAAVAEGCASSIQSEKDLIKIPIRDAHSDLKSVKLPRSSWRRSICSTCHLQEPRQYGVHLAPQEHEGRGAGNHPPTDAHDRSGGGHDGRLVGDTADLSIADLIRPAEGFGPHTTIPVDFAVCGQQGPGGPGRHRLRMVGLDISKVK
jgi:hypothetical protein